MALKINGIAVDDDDKAGPFNQSQHLIDEAITRVALDRSIQLYLLFSLSIQSLKERSSTHCFEV